MRSAATRQGLSFPTLVLWRRPGGLLAQTIFTLAAIQPTAVCAQDYTLCVDQGGANHEFACGHACEGPTHSTVAGALDVAALYPDVSPGVRPAVQVCVLSSPVHTESIVVDNSGGALGALQFNFLGNNLCPEPGSPNGEPVVEWLSPFSDGAGRSDSARHFVLDLRQSGPCGPGLPRVGIVVTGPGSLVLSGTFAGTGGGAVLGLDGPQPAHVRVEDSHFLDTLGAVVDVHGPVAVYRSEILGARLGPETGGGALLRAHDPHGGSLQAVTIAGASLDGSSTPGVAAVRGAWSEVRGSAFIANALYQAGVFRLGFTSAGYVNESGLVIGSRTGIVESTIARNVLVVASAPLPIGENAASASGWPFEAVRSTPPESELALFATPVWGQTSESGALIFIEADEGLADGSEGLSFRTSIVGNRVGVGPLIAVDADVPDVSLQLLHNTIADNGGAAVLAVIGLRGDSMLAVLRNLYAPSTGEFPSGPLVEVSGPTGGVFVSGNVGHPSLTWLGNAVAADEVIDGPSVNASAISWMDPAWTASSGDPCNRVDVACGTSTEANCEMWPEAMAPCLPDLAAAFVPDGAWVATLGDSWPWTGDWFHGSTATWSTPGATGWRCAPVRGTVDRTVTNTGSWGDGDGYPDALDCDNDDPSVVPALPPFNGYSSPYLRASRRSPRG